MVNVARYSSQDKREPFHTTSVIGNYLNMYFSQGQGVRLGESSVVSLKVHQVVPGRQGHVKILTNRDAGQTLLDYIDPGQVVHLDVFHQIGTVNPRKVAQRIFHAILEYIETEELGSSFLEEDGFQYALDYAQRIQVVSGGEQGLVYDLFQGKAESTGQDSSLSNHVRILAKLSPEKYGMILVIAEAVEEAIIDSGLQLARVKKIFHGKEKEAEVDLTGFVAIPWKRTSRGNLLAVQENQVWLILKLTERVGTVEEVEELLESYSLNILKRRNREEKKRKWGDLQQLTQQLEQIGILRNTLLGPVLTRNGNRLVRYMKNHRCEIEAEIRRNIRRTPRNSSRIRSFGVDNHKLSSVEYINRNKVIRIKDVPWPGNIAVPDTIIHATKSRLLRQEERLVIRKEDLHVYQKRSFVPVDICLLIDASMSMAGEKRQAACYLAEHILLTGREKVAVVTFQEMRADVVVPFTRNQRILERGLARIRPGGMTPLADGIVTSVDLIKGSRVDNPVLVLITDGMPNFPLWTFDAKRDALEAARRIADNKIKFICIGVDSNSHYLKELTDIGKGKLYIVDDLNRNNLIDIVKYEKRAASCKNLN